MTNQPTVVIIPAETTPHGDWELVMSFESDVYIIERGFGETHRSRILQDNLFPVSIWVDYPDLRWYAVLCLRRKGKNSLYMSQPETRSIRVSPLIFINFSFRYSRQLQAKWTRFKPSVTWLTSPIISAISSSADGRIGRNDRPRNLLPAGGQHLPRDPLREVEPTSDLVHDTMPHSDGLTPLPFGRTLEYSTVSEIRGAKKNCTMLSLSLSLFPPPIPIVPHFHFFPLHSFPPPLHLFNNRLQKKISII